MLIMKSFMQIVTFILNLFVKREKPTIILKTNIILQCLPFQIIRIDSKIRKCGENIIDNQENNNLNTKCKTKSIIKHDKKIDCN